MTATNAANRDYAQPVSAALDGPLTVAMSGFAGTASDPLTGLDQSFSYQQYQDASGGNVVQGARVAVRGDGTFTLALGFGAGQTEAVGAAESSLGAGFPAARKLYEAGWAAYDATLKAPPLLSEVRHSRARELRAQYYLSANVTKASEDKTFPGAIVASVASPWGQAVSAGDPSNTYISVDFPKR